MPPLTPGSRPWSVRLRWLPLLIMAGAACTTGAHVFPDGQSGESAEPTTVATTAGVTDVSETAGGTAASTTASTAPAPTVAASTTTIPAATAFGLVTTADGNPLPGVEVTIGEMTAVTNERGRYALTGAPLGPMTVARPAWVVIESDFTGVGPAHFVLEPFVVRGIRANRVVFNEEKWENILSLAEQTAVNTIVFDTKDESGQVIYDSQVPLASEIGAVNVIYDPVERIAEAKERGLYTITRIVTFEDNVWSRSGDAQIIGNWVDARNEANWSYPIDLGVEACELGFDEVQYDYVRFPAGATGGELNRREGLTQEIRVGAIQNFLAQAREAINPLGCAVSADVFAIVMSAPDDQGIGQRPEELSPYLDAISPMIYPSHYSNGWLGFDDPNEHNAEVTADALDDGAPRIAEGTLMRPWLQAFYYNASEVLEGINEAEARGFGWMLWNANGNYELEWLPPLPEKEEVTDTSEATDG